MRNNYRYILKTKTNFNVSNNSIFNDNRLKT